MSHLKEININEPEKWDSIVKSFDNYDVNYLSGYAKAFHINGDGDPLLIYFDNGCTRAMNVIMKRDIGKMLLFRDRLPINENFDIISPYGYGGFWIEGDNYVALNNDYDQYCNDQEYISEFIRFHLYSDYQNYYTGNVETHTHNVVRSLELSLTEIYKDFEHKVRKNLKRATSSGLEILVDQTGEWIDEFLKIYHGTMNRTSATTNFFFKKEFFNILNTLKDNCVYFYVLTEGQIVAAELVLYGTENCYSFLGGTDSYFFNLRPNEFLKYEVIKWAKNKNLKRFILGGGYGHDDGIFKYKKSLAPKGIIDFYVGKRIINQQKYNQLVELKYELEGINIETEGFFPLYRA